MQWNSERGAIEGGEGMRIILLLIFACCGCAKPMSNDEIIKETKKCENAGLSAEYARTLGGRIVDVQCGPKEK